MKSKNLESDSRILLFAVLSITLFFDPGMADPFNVPKMLILVLFSAFLLSKLLYKKNAFKNDHLIRRAGLGCLLLFLFMAISAVLSSNKLISIFGENGRKNGLITYFALFIVFISFFIIFNATNVKNFVLLTIFIGQGLSIYGFLQLFNLDPIEWNIIYNPIILTVGNPNFAAALMAIVAVLVFPLVFDSQTGIKLRLYISSLIIQLFMLILFSRAVQGIFTFIIGVFFISIWLGYLKNKKMTLILTSITLIPMSIVFLGLLQIGPLTEIIYKQSISLRGYYWRAGISMFLNHPVAGVGLDNYGSYFKQYREVGYPLSVGYVTGSNNAHNTFIQLFATGGFFVGLIYLILMLFIFITGIKSLRILPTNDRTIMLGLIGAFLGFQAQSLVSIDNIGISIWNYAISGCILAIAKDQEIGINQKVHHAKSSLKNFEILQPVFAMILLIPMLVFSISVSKTEKLVMQTYGLYTSNSEKQIFITTAQETLERPLLDDFYRMRLEARLSDYGVQDLALVELEKILDSNPRDLQSLEIVSLIHERLGNNYEVIKYRTQISELDPWNAQNYLKLGKIYRNIQDYESVNLMLVKIKSFAAGTEISETANIELLD
jgi:O-antigen ligase